MQQVATYDGLAYLLLIEPVWPWGRLLNHQAIIIIADSFCSVRQYIGSNGGK